jgi:hypothetical protein
MDLIPSIGPGTAVAVMFVIFLLTDLTARGLHVSGLPGFGFAAGSVVAACCTRQRGLLTAVTTPPVIFLTAVALAELITMHLNHVAFSPGLLGANVFLTLAAAAPWLFGGLGGALLIATIRGLPRAIRDLRAELLGRTMRDYSR